jgi:hypothetical protein
VVRARAPAAEQQDRQQPRNELERQQQRRAEHQPDEVAEQPDGGGEPRREAEHEQEADADAEQSDERARKPEEVGGRRRREQVAREAGADHRQADREAGEPRQEVVVAPQRPAEHGEVQPERAEPEPARARDDGAGAAAEQQCQRERIRRDRGEQFDGPFPAVARRDVPDVSQRPIRNHGEQQPDCGCRGSDVTRHTPSCVRKGKGVRPGELRRSGTQAGTWRRDGVLTVASRSKR